MFPGILATGSHSGHTDHGGVGVGAMSGASTYRDTPVGEAN